MKPLKIEHSTALWYLGNQICACYEPHCNSKGWAAVTHTVLILGIVASNTGRMVKSWPSGARKWTFPIPALTDNCSFPFPYILFCSVLVFAAPFTSFLWHDSFVQFFLPHPVWAELWMQQSAPAGQRHRMRWWLPREEDRGTSRFPAQSSCCLVLCILCYPVVSLSQDCTLLFP